MLWHVCSLRDLDPENLRTTVPDLDTLWVSRLLCWRLMALKLVSYCFFSILLKMIFFHAIVRLAASVSFSRRQHQATAGSVAVFI